MSHKVDLPAPIEGYVRRPDVETRCSLLNRRLTVLHAPGGFGKTALLADRCRMLRKQGLAVAWLSLDEEDGPESVALYLVLRVRGIFAKLGARGRLDAVHRARAQGILPTAREAPEAPPVTAPQDPGA